MGNLRKQRDGKTMKGSATPRTALHSAVPVRTLFSHNNFLHISPDVINVGINWRFALRKAAEIFDPEMVEVYPTGWYIVFQNSKEGYKNCLRCLRQLNNKKFDNKKVIFTEQVANFMEISSEYVYHLGTIAV